MFLLSSGESVALRFPEDVSEVHSEALPGLHCQLERRVLNPVQHGILDAVHNHVKPVSIPDVDRGRPFVFSQLNLPAVRPALDLDRDDFAIGPVAFQIVAPGQMRRGNIDHAGVEPVYFEVPGNADRHGFDVPVIGFLGLRAIVGDDQSHGDTLEGNDFKEVGPPLLT